MVVILTEPLLNVQLQRRCFLVIYLLLIDYNEYPGDISFIFVQNFCGIRFIITKITNSKCLISSDGLSTTDILKHVKYFTTPKDVTCREVFDSYCLRRNMKVKCELQLELYPATFESYCIKLNAHTQRFMIFFNVLDVGNIQHG